MSVLRAVSACPMCSCEEEVWYYRGKIVPTHVTECQTCSYVYASSDFIVALLDLYENATISANAIATNVI